MTIAEVMIEALHLMFAENGDVLLPAEIETYRNDPQYRDYLAAMPGAINRCFSDMEAKGVLRSNTKMIDMDDVERTDYALVYDTATLGDCAEVERVALVDGDERCDVSFEWLGDGKIGLPKVRDGFFLLTYRPKIRRITAAVGYGEEIGVPDIVATAVPYFIKGDLFRSDEPAEAGEARNFYEAAMAQLYGRSDGVQARVEDVFFGGGF